MNRLPINLLLYVAILALLGGSGWHFYQAAVVERKSQEARQLDRDRNLETFQRLIARGAEGAGEIAVGPNYAERPELWNALRDANFTGKEPPPPPEAEDPGAADAEPVAVPQTPLEDIFVLAAVVEGADASRIVIRYKPEANIEPPPEAIPPAWSSGMDVAAAQPQGRPAMPTFPNDPLGVVHHLALEETLWPPYAHVRLVRVAGETAVFVREDPKVPKEEWQEETIYPEVLSLPQSVLKRLAETGISVAPNEIAAQPESAPPQSSGWQPVEHTSEIDGRIHIGTRDREVFRRDPNRIFNQDIGTESWRSANGQLRGVRITKLAPGYDSYGLEEGSIIIALNGQPVTSKEQAYKLGKAEYRRGVRSFVIEFLTPLGGRTSRTYVAPDE